MKNILFKTRDLFFKNKKYLLFILIFTLIIPSVIVGETGNVGTEVMGVRPKASETPNMTIIIGTYMIAINSLTEELNNVAEKSAISNSQSKVYYKSELVDETRTETDNNGVWYEVQDAQDIGDILPSGKKMVDDDFIDSLILTHYVDKSGRTYELETGQEVDIFNLENVYDVSAMDELKSLKLEYDAKKGNITADDEEKQSIEAEKGSLKSVFELDVQDEKTKVLDLELEMLKKYRDYQSLNNASDEQRDEVIKISGAINAKRKILVIEKVIEKIDKEIQNVSTLADSYSEAKNELMSSKTSLEAQSSILDVDDNMSLIQKKTVTLTNEFINYVKENNYKNADESLLNILAVNNIINSIVADIERQLNLISVLESEVNETYEPLIIGGESDEYKQAKVLNKSQAVLDDFKNKYRDKLKSLEADLELLENMKLKLLNTVEKQIAEIQSVIDELNRQIERLNSEISVPNQQESLLDTSGIDVFKEIAIGNLKIRLSNELKKLQAANSLIIQDSDKVELEFKLEKLKLEYKKAIDRNDLAKAKEIEVSINDIQASLDEKNKEITTRLEALKAQLVSVESQLSKENLQSFQKSDLESQKLSIESLISQLESSKPGKHSAAQKIINEAKVQAQKSIAQNPMREQDVTELADSLSKIKSVANSQSQIAYLAMEDIYEGIQSKIATDSLTPSSLLDVADEISTTLDELKSKNSDQVSEDLDSETLQQKIDAFAEDNNLSDYSKNILSLGALNELLISYGQVDEDTLEMNLNGSQKIIKSKINEKISILVSSENKSTDIRALLINKKMKNSEIYAPAEVTAGLLGMRYIWEQSLVKGYLVGNGQKYTFIQGSKTVLLKDKKMKMNNVAIFEPNKKTLESDMWLPQSFLLTELNVTVQDIKMTVKAIVYDEYAYDMMKKMLNSIK